MKKYQVHRPTRQIKPGAEHDLIVKIEEFCRHQKDDMFRIEPDLMSLKINLEGEIEKMPRRSVAIPTEMFHLTIEQNPKVLRIYKKTHKGLSNVWCSVWIVNENE